MTKLPNKTQLSQSHEYPLLLESQNIFQQSLIKIRKDRLQLDGGSPYDYYSLISYPYSVAILASTMDDEFILNIEYRHPTGRFILGCPGGFLEEDENPLEGARRELLEETGYSAESFKLIGSAFPYTGFTGQKTIFVRAYGSSFLKNQKLETSEIIRPILLKSNKLNEKINEGCDVDGVLCSALFFNSIFK